MLRQDEILNAKNFGYERSLQISTLEADYVHWWKLVKRSKRLETGAKLNAVLLSSYKNKDRLFVNRT